MPEPRGECRLRLPGTGSFLRPGKAQGEGDLPAPREGASRRRRGARAAMPAAATERQLRWGPRWPRPGGWAGRRRGKRAPLAAGEGGGGGAPLQAGAPGGSLHGGMQKREAGSRPPRSLVALQRCCWKMLCTAGKGRIARGRCFLQEGRKQQGSNATRRLFPAPGPVSFRAMTAARPPLRQLPASSAWATPAARLAELAPRPGPKNRAPRMRRPAPARRGREQEEGKREAVPRGAHLVRRMRASPRASPARERPFCPLPVGRRRDVPASPGRRGLAEGRRAPRLAGSKAAAGMEPRAMAVRQRLEGAVDRWGLRDVERGEAWVGGVSNPSFWWWGAWEKPIPIIGRGWEADPARILLFSLDGRPSGDHRVRICNQILSPRMGDHKGINSGGGA